MWTLGFNTSKNQKITLPSGKEITIQAIGKIYYRASEPGIMLQYFTNLDIENIDLLRSEVNEIWSMFRKQADESGLDSVVISANSLLSKKFFVSESKTRNFAFIKNENGSWRSVNSQTSELEEGFPVKFGVIENRNGVALVFEESTSIPLLTKDRDFYFGFTIFPPDNEPYNFSCILLSPDLTKLSNVTGEMIQEIASSPNSKQQFRFPTRRAAGITTLPMWLDAGDPPGEYGIEIYLNDELVYSVDFTVYEPES